MNFRFSFASVWKPLLAGAVILGSAVLISAPGPEFTVHDKAYYADPNLVNFVRPGLVTRVISVEIAADGTVRARFKITDPRGLGLDRLGVTTPGVVSTSFVLATIPRGQKQYWAYTNRRVTSPLTGRTAEQATSDTGGSYQQVGEGEYIYTFGTKVPTGYDRTATHTVAVYSNRNLNEFDLGVNLDDDAYSWVPAGGAVTVTRDVVRIETCNKCHDRLALHGTTGRISMPVCVTCHTLQTTDPDTGNTVDMVTMVHRIHAGSSLPSVEAGGKYQIIGFGQSVHDYSRVAFPSDVRRCDACHESGKGAAQERAWLTSPSRQACGACHDDVNFATGDGHVGLPQLTDNQCATCHIPEGEIEFDASIKGAHTVPEESKVLPGTTFDVLSVTGAAPGQRPSVTFSIRDKAGRPIRAADMNRVAIVMAGPAADYNTYVSDDALRAEGPGDGRHFWTMTTPLPATARGTWSVGIEGYKNITLLPGTLKERTVRDAGLNKVMHFSVDGSRMEPRRANVDLNKCNACHYKLSLHGGNRTRIEQCVLCHNPAMTDAAVRPADKKPDESIDFRSMIHRIHTGHEMTRDYTVYGRGSTAHNYNEVGYPGFRQNCDGCHINNSQQLPLPTGLLRVVDPRGWLNPVGPTAAACLGCHSDVYAASHALANTSQLGESCAVCHGPNADFAVNRVHAVTR